MQKTRGFEVVESWARHTDGLVLEPVRSTQKSAGYDFFLTEDIVLAPDNQVLVWTDIKAYMLDDEVLELHVRSSIGIKKNLMLANITGIIDADYYSNLNNDGNIGICLRNVGNEIVHLEKGERVAQGIFKKYLVADNCNHDGERLGGIGSTN